MLPSRRKCRVLYRKWRAPVKDTIRRINWGGLFLVNHVVAAGPITTRCPTFDRNSQAIVCGWVDLEDKPRDA